MVRTRVGYTGGQQLHPTYRDIGDHSEALQVDFDPRVLSYPRLLEIFWAAHNPVQRNWSRQYRAAVFWHDERQRRLAQASLARVAEQVNGDIHTQVLSFNIFYLAEGYHQKHSLRAYPDLLEEYQQIYPDTDSLVDSTAAARVNGYLGGFGSTAQLDLEMGELGLSEQGQTILRQIAGRRQLSCLG